MPSRICAAAAVCLLGVLLAYGEDRLSLTIRGRITTDSAAPSIRIQLEDPKNKSSVVSLMADEAGRYEFRELQERAYTLSVWIDGKRRDRRNLEIVCRSGGTMTKDLFYGNRNSTLTFYFPAEDPDVVDAAELLGNYPKDVLREYERAYEDATNGNILRAVQRLDAITLRAPGFYGAHARLGMIYQQNGCYADAELEYGSASGLSPRSAQPLVNLASVQIQASEGAGDPLLMVGRALENLKKALSIKPSSIAYCLSGAAYARISSYDEAERNFKRALDLSSAMPAARLMLAKLYMDQEDWEGAVEHLKAYLKDHPLAADRGLVKEMHTKAERNLKSRAADR